MAPKAAKTTVEKQWDWDRAVPMDPRDPRSLTTQWPCMGNHNPMKWHSNKWAQWRHCAICALRLDYVPSLGSPANSTSQPNPGTVAQALKELKNMMGPLPPTESMVRVIIDKVTAEHRLTVMMDQHKMEMEKAMGKVNMAKLMFQKGQSKGNKGYSKPEASEGPHAGSPSSSADWEKMTPPEPKELDPINYLTEEEKLELLNLARQRASAINNPDEDVELEPDYSNPQ